MFAGRTLSAVGLRAPASVRRRCHRTSPSLPLQPPTRSAPGLAWLSVLHVITLKCDLPCHSPINEDRKPEKTQAFPSRSAASGK